MKQVRKQLLELTQAWEDACDKLGREPVAVWLCGVEVSSSLECLARWKRLGCADLPTLQPSEPSPKTSPTFFIDMFTPFLLSIIRS